MMANLCCNPSYSQPVGAGVGASAVSQPAGVIPTAAASTGGAGATSHPSPAAEPILWQGFKARKSE